MAATRKLQSEIDRVLKKVQEGVDVFDSIWNKVYDTDNANQKEKFEADLKKEIKKLQRYRDQIKSWIQSSEIKDKKALIEARKLIEKEMERFKVCEKETKTKAFSKEGLGQQPKQDPKEKAKNESRDWLNNMVTELESQIDTFESEMEGLQVKKGKQRPPRLVHLEESITRHKSHIMKLEMILRLLENDELNSDQVNDVKDMVEDYVERNQDDFDDFEDVESIYNTLPIEKLEALENLENIPSISPSIVNKEKAALSGNSASPINVTLKNITSISNHSSNSQATSIQDDSSESSLSVVPQSLSQSDSVSDTSSPKSLPMGKHLTSSTSNLSVSTTATPAKVASSASSKSFSRSNSAIQRTKEDEIVNAVSAASKKSSPVSGDPGSDSSVSAVSSAQSTISVQGELNSKPESPVQAKPNSNQSSQSNFSNITSPAKILSNSTSSKFSDQYIASVVDTSQTFGLGPGTGAGLSLGNLGEPNSNSSNVISAQQRLFNSVGAQWRPGISSSSVFQNQSESFPTRPEIPPDQKQRYISRFQQVQQQGLSGGLMYGIGQNLSASQALSSQSSSISGQNYMQSILKAQLQKYQNQSQNQLQGQTQSTPQSQGLQSGLSNFDQLNFQQQKQFATKNSPNFMLNQINQTQDNMNLDQKIQNSKMHNFPSILQRQNLTGFDSSKSVIGPSSSSSNFSKKASSVEDPKFVDQNFGTELSGNDLSSQLSQNQVQLHNTNMASLHQNPQSMLRSPPFGQNQSQPLNSQTISPSNQSVFPPNQTLASLNQNSLPNQNLPGQSQFPIQNTPGVIGRRIGGDLGAIGDNLTSTPNVTPGAPSPLDYDLNLALLESAYRNIPSTKDSERQKSYTPKNPVLTPKSYPQTPSAIIDNPSLWEKLDTDVLFFAFYYQQGTYQQYLAARELKKQSWRYHKKYNTWFQRHEEPKITTDEYEQGTYVYFDFHIVHDDLQTGWCQRIKTEFTFEYCYLEDELIV